MKSIIWLLLLCPFIAFGQLKEFEVSNMVRPDVAVVQANAQWSDDALLLVYSSLDGLQFRSSMGVVDKQTYNNTAGRYEILVKPVKQMMFVAKPGFMEQKVSTINPNPKDVFYFMAEEKESEVVSTNPGKVKIITDPPGANLYLNGIKTADFTPFTGSLNPGETKILIEKAKYETLDTTVIIRGKETTVIDVNLIPTTVWLNVLSTPSGATVNLDGKDYGRTPFSYEWNLSAAENQTSKILILKLDGYDEHRDVIKLVPSKIPLEFKHEFKVPKGQYQVTSSPSGSQVFIDGMYRGVTPLSGDMNFGSYDVKVQLDGYENLEKEFLLKSKFLNEIHFQLQSENKNTVSQDYSSNTQITNQSGDFEIGQSYGGGKIVYVDNTGNHGLIAAPDDIRGPVSWGENGITRATSRTNGKRNSDQIVEYFVYYKKGRYLEESAANICLECNDGGYTDWYLPAIDELRHMFDNRFEIGGFSGDDYCSSTEKGPKDIYAIHFKPHRRIEYYYNKVDRDYHIRCVRKF